MKTPVNTLSLAAYTRVSTHGQATSGIGLAAQRQTIKDAAAAQGFTIGEWFEDAGKSGSKMTGRSGLQAALAAIRGGTYGGLVVAKIDRLGRSYETMTLVGDASREGGGLVARGMGLDSATAEGELVAGALTMAARFEWRRISQRQREKFEELRRQGRKRGRPATPREVADWIVAMRDGGATYQAIADALNADKVPTVRGGSEWRPSSVRSALVSRQAELLAQTA